MATSSLTTALRETLGLFDEAGAPQTTTEIAEQLGLGRRATYERLDRLVEQDCLETKKVGGNGRVWWQPPHDTTPDTGDTHSGQPRGMDSNVFKRAVEGVREYAIFTLDTEGYIQSWNLGAERIKGYEADEILNEHIAVFYTEDERADGIPEQNLSAAADQGSVEDEGWRVRKDGSRFWATITLTAIHDEDGNLDGYLKIIRDVTERREHEQTLTEQTNQLEQQRDEFERELDRISDGFYALDTDLKFRYLNERAKEVLELDESAIGTNIVDVVPTTDAFEDALSKALDTTESVTFEDYYDSVDKWFHNAIYPSENGLSVYFRDITERKERERALRDAKAQLEAATEAAKVGTWRWNISEDEMVTGSWFAETFGVDPEAAREGVPLETYVSAIHEDDRDRVEARVEQALASCGEYEEEYRVWNTDDELRWVVARGHVECDEDGNPITFPGALVDITERKRAQMELERQREELATLNNLNAIVSEITDTVIEKSTREEIEQVVCDALAATDSYEFVWLAGVDSQTDTLEPRATAGTEGYAENITVSLDTDDPGNQGPGATALREQETQVIQDVFSDPDFEPWRAAAAEYGFSSIATIPIVHEGIVYGILAVYADRQNAFDTTERAVVSRLGEVVGHAIASVERKHALMSEEVVELTFQVRDIFEELGGPGEPEGTVTFDEVVPLGNSELLVYGTATADARDSIEQIIEILPQWESVSFHDAGGETTFELRMSDDTVLSTLASLGGELQEAVIEDGDYQLTVQLPAGTNVRPLIEAVQENYDRVEVVKHSQITRTDPQSDAGNAVIADLTDRQRATLKAAYHSGFFEWPRDNTGEDIADSLGVTPPTFHQHLRKAEKKLIRATLPSGEA